jgi:hypothetical protein
MMYKVEGGGSRISQMTHRTQLAQGKTKSPDSVLCIQIKLATLVCESKSLFIGLYHIQEELDTRRTSEVQFSSRQILFFYQYF